MAGIFIPSGQGMQYLHAVQNPLPLLEILLMQVGKVVSKDRISQRLASDGDALADNAIEVAIHRLRKRLKPYQTAIRTVRGLGYLLEAGEHGA